MNDTERARYLAGIDHGRADIKAGRVVDGELVDEWLASWATDREQAAFAPLVASMTNPKALAMMDPMVTSAHMQHLTLVVDSELSRALGKTPTEAESECRVLLAAKLFELGRLSIGRAASIAGLPIERFMLKLGELNIPVINFDDDELEYELRRE